MDDKNLIVEDNTAKEKDLISSEDVLAVVNGDQVALVEQMERAKEVALEQLQDASKISKEDIAKKKLEEEEKKKAAILAEVKRRKEEAKKREELAREMQERKRKAIEEENQRRILEQKRKEEEERLRKLQEEEAKRKKIEEEKRLEQEKIQQKMLEQEKIKKAKEAKLLEKERIKKEKEEAKKQKLLAKQQAKEEKLLARKKAREEKLLARKKAREEKAKAKERAKLEKQIKIANLKQQKLLKHHAQEENQKNLQKLKQQKTMGNDQVISQQRQNIHQQEMEKQRLAQQEKLAEQRRQEQESYAYQQQLEQQRYANRQQLQAEYFEKYREKLAEQKRKEEEKRVKQQQMLSTNNTSNGFNQPTNLFTSNTNLQPNSASLNQEPSNPSFNQQVNNSSLKPNNNSVVNQPEILSREVTNEKLKQPMKPTISINQPELLSQSEKTISEQNNENKAAQISFANIPEKKVDIVPKRPVANLNKKAQTEKLERGKEDNKSSVSNNMKENKEIPTSKVKESNFKYYATFIFLTGLILMVIFLPNISEMISDYKKEKMIETIPAITDGTLSCSLNKNDDNFDYYYDVKFDFSDNKLNKLNFVTKIKGDRNKDSLELSELKTTCQLLEKEVSYLEGVKVSCSLVDGVYENEQILDYSILKPESVTSAYLEAGGTYPTYKYQQNIDEIEKQMKASNYTCERYK